MYYRPTRAQDEKLNKMLEAKATLRPRMLVTAQVAKVVKEALAKLKKPAR